MVRKAWLWHVPELLITAVFVSGAGEWTQSFINTGGCSNWAPTAASIFFLWSRGWGQTESTALTKQEARSPSYISEPQLSFLKPNWLAEMEVSWSFSTHYLTLSWLFPFRIRKSYLSETFSFLLIGIFFLLFLIEPHCGDQASLDLMLSLLAAPECWNSRTMPLCQAGNGTSLPQFRLKGMLITRPRFSSLF